MSRFETPSTTLAGPVLPGAESKEQDRRVSQGERAEMPRPVLPAVPSESSHGAPVQWWRVDYHLWAAGGGLIPTCSKVPARTAEQAIWKAKAARKRRDHEAGRANCGSFTDATAEPVEDPTL